MVKVYFSAQSRKIFEKIKGDKLKNKIIQALQKLSQKPNEGKKLQGKLEGTYSLRVWPYRILYEFTKEKDIIITDIGHRKDVYKLPRAKSPRYYSLSLHERAEHSRCLGSMYSLSHSSVD